MSRLEWAPEANPYQAGVDRGVLYTAANPGVPWDGLISVREDTKANNDASRYIDGLRYFIPKQNEEFFFKITAFTYPDEFLPCSGYDDFHTGQVRQAFGFSYRTGNSTSGHIHLIYNAKATPSDSDWQTLSDSVDPVTFSWDISTRPVAHATTSPTAHVIIDLSVIYPSALADVEDILYGTAVTDPRLPDLTELVTLFVSHALLVIVDNGDGTWTATAPDEILSFLDADTFEISSDGATVIDADTYALTSY